MEFRRKAVNIIVVGPEGNLAIIKGPHVFNSDGLQLFECRYWVFRVLYGRYNSADSAAMTNCKIATGRMELSEGRIGALREPSIEICNGCGLGI